MFRFFSEEVQVDQLPPFIFLVALTYFIELCIIL